MAYRCTNLPPRKAVEKFGSSGKLSYEYVVKRTVDLQSGKRCSPGCLNLAFNRDRGVSRVVGKEMKRRNVAQNKGFAFGLSFDFSVVERQSAGYASGRGAWRSRSSLARLVGFALGGQREEALLLEMKQQVFMREGEIGEKGENAPDGRRVIDFDEEITVLFRPTVHGVVTVTRKLHLFTEFTTLNEQHLGYKFPYPDARVRLARSKGPESGL
ncbi:hypothetical protein SCHPADRAFT_932006 [Schizopora paradoxa]|uniref:Uncharacterized protein n=1 Tax=Schizopora paradoxa TaxID=27342 RepID=A0A0H2R8H7_9AGAM|nr:hypothetical protein SCHPADRAFT_932006 [Schizopora paradoxa]